MQVIRDETYEPVALAVAVVICGLFGGVLWGVRSLVLRLRQRNGS